MTVAGTDEATLKANELQARMDYLGSRRSGAAATIAEYFARWADHFARRWGPGPELGAAMITMIPVLAELHIDAGMRLGRSGTIWWCAGGKEMDMDARGRVQIYDEDAYPNDRGESFALCWDSFTGSSSQHLARTVAAELKRQGYAARVTRKGGNHGVAYVVPESTLETLRAAFNTATRHRHPAAG